MLTKRQCSYLCALNNTSNCKERKKLLQVVTNDIIKLMSNSSKRILNGTIPMHNRRKERLKKHKQIMRQLAQSTSLLKKRQLLTSQKGHGFLGAFLPLLASLITPVVSSLFQK